ncbi:MAG: hypothetical protein IPP29_14795 [Bacteroidetes bacterium]|nr:hypothetical protein [Bacteroidota bacterium]
MPTNFDDAVIAEDGNKLFFAISRGLDKGVRSCSFKQPDNATLICNVLQNPDGVSVIPKKLALLPYDGDKYKVLIAAAPSLIDNNQQCFFELEHSVSNSNICNLHAITNPLACTTQPDIFNNTNVDDVDHVDEGVTAISVNANTNTIYVATVYRNNTLNVPVRSHVYRKTYNKQTGFIDPSTCWEDVMVGANAVPNKTIIAMNSSATDDCLEILYVALRGLGGWRFDNKPYTISQNVRMICAATGTATVTPTNANFTYTYLWSNGNSTATSTGLGVGTHIVEITATPIISGPTCTFREEFTFIQNDLAAEITSTKTNCTAINVTLTGIASGGLAPYGYTWNNGTTGTNVVTVADQNYALTVTDAAGCTVTAQYVKVCNLTVNIQVHTDACTNSQQLNAIPSVCHGPYTYSWTDGTTAPSITEKIVNIASSTLTYTVTVTNAHGCSITNSVTPAPFVPGFTVNISTDNINSGCPSLNGFRATAVPSQAGTYTYLWSNGQTNQQATGLVAGSTYDVEVRQLTGNCRVTSVVTIIYTPPLPFDGTVTHFRCNANKGAIVLALVSSCPTCTYIWSNGASTTNVSSLAPGDYTVEVKDGTPCNSRTFTVLDRSIKYSIIQSAGICNAGAVQYNAAVQLKANTYNSNYLFME